jgi:RNA recognition motif-containing protein
MEAGGVFCYRENMKTRRTMNKKIYVSNLPSQATESELKILFSNAGDVMSVKIVEDRQTGQPRGFAFVEMSSQWEARRAVSMLNKKSFMGKELLVKEARVSRSFRRR